MTSKIMPFHKFFLLFFFIRFLYSSATEFKEKSTFLSPYCSSNKTFTADSAFQSDLNTLITYLTSNNTDNTEFYNTSVAGDGDTVFGLFMCRGYVTIEECHQCIVRALQRLPNECERSKEAMLWYDDCILRYSNRSFFSTVNTRPRLGVYNTGNISDQASFMRLLLTTMNEIADEVAKPAMGERKYAKREKETNIPEFETLYCLAQCTPDLSPDDCRRCLSDAIGDLHWCCDGKQGGRVLYPSCYLRYEVYPFYNSDPQENGKSQSAKTIVIIVVVSLVGTGILLCFAYYLLKSRKIKGRRAVLRQKYFGNESTTLKSLQFSLATIKAATNNFSHQNSLGKGGFGQVYKMTNGIFSNGQVIAVKRLSKDSGQGAKEFKNEVLLIAKLQHRNLVALLGFCLEQREKILIYEYVPNRSLDYFLFDSQKSKVLNWVERCKIIGGVARGILYLHEYSRLKIIHRDLKLSNILLDDEMNPKISDFSLAKLVAINANEGSTNRIVGTYGYMSPEYAMFGQYSEKSDVFSFGVIVLEIISGKKNIGSHHQSQDGDSLTLLSYAWKQWRDEKLLEILDPNIKEFGSYNEVIKCIQIGLLCVQENPDARPSMADVVSYLSNYSIQMPFPEEPASFFLHRRIMETSVSGSKELSGSTIEVSMSEYLPR